jgi:two-component system chemotaxis response regulator CheY
MATILLIDDNVQVRYVLRMMLSVLGHEVVEAEDGQHGLEAFQQRPAEVVFCDLFMPNKEGLETIRELRQLAPGVKIVAMSGGSANFGKPDFLQMAQTFGADATLSKPFDVQVLRETVAQLLSEPEGGTAPHAACAETAG